MWLIGHPRVWTAIFATHRDRRDFVETCLERSQNQPLEVTVDINDQFWVPGGCSCENDGYGKLLQNEESPCEWHFLFELLAQPTVSERIKVLRINSSSRVVTPPRDLESSFDLWTHTPRLLTRSSFSESFPSGRSWTPVLDLKQCRFFLSTFQRLTTLVWDDQATNYARLLFSAPRPFPELKSVTFEGYWHQSLSLTQVRNLTSFTIKRYLYTLGAEEFKSFLLNNLSLVSLEVFITIRGQGDGDPVILPNLKSLSIDCDPKALSTILQVPPSQRFSALFISLEHGRDNLYSLHAPGKEVTPFAKARAPKVQEDWQHLIGQPVPSIRHIAMYDKHTDVISTHNPCSPMTGAHTLDIGLTYSRGWDNSWIWDKLKLLEELKVIRFEVLGETNRDLCDLDGEVSSNLDPLWDRIVDLVEHRFRNGQPLHTVQAMVVSRDRDAGQLQDVLWKRPFEDRSVQKYLAPGN